jgi:hypothetical protein
MAAQITDVYEELLAGRPQHASLRSVATDTPERKNRQHSENENVALNATGAGQ